MVFLLIFLYSCIDIEANLLNEYSSNEDYISIHGRCYDIHTGESITIKGSAVSELNNSMNFTSNSLGELDFKLPIDSKIINFESIGYRKVTLPINIIKYREKGQKFIINIPMTNIDSTEIIHPNYLFLAFSIVDSVEINYTISLIENPTNSIYFSFKSGETQNTLTFENFDKIGNYTFEGSLEDGRVVVSESFYLNAGLNFMNVNVKSSIKNAGRNILDKREYDEKYYIHFDQSEFFLKDSAKLVLDVLSNILKENGGLIIEITGHTHNAGKEELNLTLSEYRARVAAKYLEQKGVPANHIDVKWKGSSSPLFPNDTEVNRKKNRRVELQIRKMR
jgi:outer membrane protein OmpA-like peptidoglycan-associated protein